ncbi:MAG: sugar ABC transporter ATP-binding protein [Candidatus Hadarchaeum sp.]|uniref:sugar ABC transporter ATP-binding protein n=1 Tax=Candidatus Hadarchaeum sp. TaxID=2883567 RepID=UPI00316EE01B
MFTWRLENWTKFFGKTAALHGVSLVLESNKIYGLVGPNGSGKSTLIKALTGVVSLNSGKLFKDEEEIFIASPEDAYRQGICAAYQELALIPDLSVIENLELFARLNARLNHKKYTHVLERYFQILEYFRASFPLTERIKNLTRSDQQIIELVKAFSFSPTLLLLDEPTSFLSLSDIDKLFALIRSFREAATIVFVSHRLSEVLNLCDEVVVLKDGINIAKFSAREVNIDEVVSLMGGVRGVFSAGSTPQQTHEEQREPFFYAHVNTSKVHDVNIKVAKGEVLGLAGLVGHGQSEVLQVIAGLRSGHKDLSLGGRRITIRKPADAVRAGIVYISGSATDVVLPHRPIRENVSLILNSRVKFYTLIKTKHEKNIARDMVKKLNIVCRSIDEPLQFLSGGNQQKTVLARAICSKPNVLLLDDPLKGIDTATKSEFYGLISEAAKDMAIIFFSSDVEELLPVSSRILVMYEGKIVAEFSGSNMTKENILAASLQGG